MGDEIRHRIYFWQQMNDFNGLVYYLTAKMKPNIIHYSNRK
jgi:hypothetical protein